VGEPIFKFCVVVTLPVTSLDFSFYHTAPGLSTGKAASQQWPFFLKNLRISFFPCSFFRPVSFFY